MTTEATTNMTTTEMTNPPTARSQPLPSQGKFDEIQLLPILRACARMNASGIIDVRMAGHAGMIVLDRGSVVEAHWSKYRGDEAVFRLLFAQTGRWALRAPQQASTVPPTYGWSLTELINAHVDRVRLLRAQIEMLGGLSKVWRIDLQALGASVDLLGDHTSQQSGPMLSLLDDTRPVGQVIAESPLSVHETIQTLLRLLQLEIIIDVEKISFSVIEPSQETVDEDATVPPTAQQRAEQEQQEQQERPERAREQQEQQEQQELEKKDTSMEELFRSSAQKNHEISDDNLEPEQQEQEQKQASDTEIPDEMHSEIPDEIHSEIHDEIHDEIRDTLIPMPAEEPAEENAVSAELQPAPAIVRRPMLFQLDEPETSSASESVTEAAHPTVVDASDPQTPQQTLANYVASSWLSQQNEAELQMQAMREEAVRRALVRQNKPDASLVQKPAAQPASPRPVTGLPTQSLGADSLGPQGAATLIHKVGVHAGALYVDQSEEYAPPPRPLPHYDAAYDDTKQPHPQTEKQPDIVRSRPDPVQFLDADSGSISISVVDPDIDPEEAAALLLQEPSQKSVISPTPHHTPLVDHDDTDTENNRENHPEQNTEHDTEVLDVPAQEHAQTNDVDADKPRKVLPPIETDSAEQWMVSSERYYKGDAPPSGKNAWRLLIIAAVLAVVVGFLLAKTWG